MVVSVTGFASSRGTPGWRSIRTRRSVAVAIAALLAAGAAHADLWAYVDPQGRSHFADHQVDARYKLFFKGETTLDVRNRANAERAKAQAALAGTPLYRNLTDDKLVRRYATLIDRYARANRLDAALVTAIVAVESGFDAHAVSPKGAVGLMQILPATAERYGLVEDARRTVADRLHDPATNLRIGTRYFADLLARFDGDLSLALAAYNAGEGSVAAYDNSVPPFGETRDFVRLVQQAYVLVRPPPDAPGTGVRLTGRKDAK
ncbi:MAG TPA: lytic transglycosylase domain-containing protein [Casimicrobiaceae bacterium]|nr:lytic transglycosylase domain-containing protein [Casimicrobiaceae bacterium]